MTTTADFIREMRALCEKVTPEPWNIHAPFGGGDGISIMVAGNPRPKEIAFLQLGFDAHVDEEQRKNAIFITVARTALPEALDRLEKLEAENETLREELRQKQIDEDLRKGVDRYDLD